LRSRLAALATAEATVNAIHNFREARVVGNRKRSRARSQSPAFVQYQLVWGWSPKADPAIRNCLEALRVKFERGEHEALLIAIDVCMRCDCKPPYWVRGGWLAAIAKWDSHAVRTLGEAFGVPSRVSEHLDDQQKRNALRWRVVARVEQLRQQRMPVDVRLFSVIDTEIGQGAGYASKLYYDEESRGLRKIIRNLKIS
jgi:hypothetical protein